MTTLSTIMTQQKHHHIQIYKNIFIISAFILIGSTYGDNMALALNFGEIKYNDNFIDYSKIDNVQTLKTADYYFDKALGTTNKIEKVDYLKKAGAEYFILTKFKPENLHSILQLARIYDYIGKDSYAKGYFFQALKIDNTNAKTNYYFGDFYYTRRKYTRALYFYNKAYENGLQSNSELILKMASIYEKLGDLLRANQYYKKAYLLDISNKKLPDKIRSIEAVKYKNTGYYKSIQGK